MLREGNVFASVCLLTEEMDAWSHVLGEGKVCQRGGGGGYVYPSPKTWDLGYPTPRPYLVPTTTVGQRAVRILLDCFLVHAFIHFIAHQREAFTLSQYLLNTSATAIKN